MNLSFLANAASAAALTLTPITDIIVSNTPAGRYQTGSRTEGAYSIRAEGLCDATTLENLYRYVYKPARNLKVYLPSATAVDQGDPNTSAKIGDFENWILSELTSARNALELAGDNLIKGHYLCIAMGDFGAVNAESLGTGYMVFSPQIFFNSTHQKNSTPLSMSVVLMHEFAHQLQYWSGESFINDQVIGSNGQLHRSARKSELQADCVAAGLVEMIHTGYAANDVRAAMMVLGDFNFEADSHHGMPFERVAAVDAGLEITRKHRAEQFGITAGLDSNKLLQECRKSVLKIGRLQ